MEIVKNFPLIIVLLLLLSAFVMPMTKNIGLIKKLSVATMGISVILCAFLLYSIKFIGDFKYMVGHYPAPWGIELKIGFFEAFIGLLFTFIAFLILWASIYNIDHDVKEKRVPLFYTLCNVLIASLLAIVYSNDIFNCFVFIEISSIASCGIVIVKDKKENLKAAMKYLILSSLGSGLVLMGIAFLYSITGNLGMDFIRESLSKVNGNYRNTIQIALGLFTAGLGVKSAMFPMHIWLPDAHTSAPSASSAILSSLVLKAYIVLYIKILYRVFGMEIIRTLPILNMVLILGICGMLFGSVLALFQKDIKRMIAYSSVAQIGYIFMGIGMGTIPGLVAAIFHILCHAFTKAALFLVSGSIIEMTGNRDISKMKGIGVEMPVTLGIFIVSAFSMIGIPLFAGFNSKWNFAIAIIDADKLLLIVVLLLSSLLNAMYYLPIIINAFFGDENLKDKVFNSKERPLKALVPMLILSLAVIYFGLASKGVLNIISIGISNL